MSFQELKNDLKESLKLDARNKPFSTKSIEKLKKKSKHIFNVIQTDAAKNRLQSRDTSLGIAIISSGFYLYLMLRSLVDLIIKHLMYIFEARSYNYEYLILIVLSTVQLFFPICLIYTNFLNNTKKIQLLRNKLSVCFLSLQLALFILMGSIQFLHNMSYWDHLIRLNDQFPIELGKFLTEVLLTIFFFSIYVLRK
jgi:hypothetical protein